MRFSTPHDRGRRLIVIQVLLHHVSPSQNLLFFGVCHWLFIFFVLGFSVGLRLNDTGAGKIAQSTGRLKVLLFKSPHARTVGVLRRSQTSQTTCHQLAKSVSAVLPSRKTTTCSNFDCCQQLPLTGSNPSHMPWPLMLQQTALVLNSSSKHFTSLQTTVVCCVFCCGVQGNC